MDVSQWHTYRFTMDGTNWNLYIDNDPDIAATLTAAPHVPEDGIPYGGYFGWFWGTTGNGDLDYLRYTDQGALEPMGEPPVCGDNGYKVSDFNTDCYVNLKDFSFIANDWLVCTDPANADCDQYWK